MTIRRLVAGSLLLLGLIAAALGAFIAQDQLATMREAGRASLRLDLLRALADIPANVNPERGVATLALQTIEPTDGRVPADLLAIRRETDTAIARAQERAAAAPGRLDDAADLANGLRSSLEIWTRSRAFTDDQMKLPIAARSAAVAQLVEQSAQLNAATMNLMSDQSRELAASNGAANRFASVASTVWEFRDVAGRHAGMLQNFVGARKPLTSDQRGALTALESQVDAIWGRLTRVLQHPSTPAAVKAAMEEVRKAYYGSFASERALLSASYATGEFPYDAATYRQKVVPVWVPVIDLRNAAYGAAADIVSTSETAARLRVQVAFGVIVLVVLALIGVLTAVQMRVMRPLADMTAAMRRLAAGDLDIDVPGTGRRDELGAMASAMNVFKSAARDKRLNDLDTETRRQSSQDATRRAEEQAAQAAIARERAFVVDTFGAGIQALAEGDLTRRLTEELPGAYEDLRMDFNAAIEGLEAAMRGVVGTATGMQSGTGEIASAADDLSRRTEQQAASLEETAAAIDQITATVRKTAEGANHARDVVANAKSDSARSGEVVQGAVAAMAEIERSSHQISQILGVIDEIAFQTNLLALNAGVEAARAGEAGRGFAVVASEVRALAQRSAAAAREIKTLIHASSSQVGAGVDLVGEAGRALSRIAEQVAEINTIVADIAASAKEQATGLAEVNTAVNQMDQVTQQNAAMVEETTAASHALAGEADHLATLVARFRVGGLPAATAKPAPRRAARSAKMAPPPARSAPPASRGNLALKQAPAPSEWEEF